MFVELNDRTAFETRHNGPSEHEQTLMLRSLGVKSLQELIEKTIPRNILLDKELSLPAPLTEFDYVTQLKATASENKILNTFIGQGYYNCIVPPVIQRNILENPGWYTAYTPYQAEIAQGRLEALLNFQTLVIDLTGMEIANASLLDEATAAAEAMSMFFGLRKKEKKNASKFLVDRKVFPQVIDVLKTRSQPLGIDLDIVDIDQCDITDPEVFGIYYQYPDDEGEVIDRSSLTAAAKEHNVLVGVGADLLALCLLTPPGEWGADAVVGTSQRLGVPFGFGGPHAAFFATRESYKRAIPGRIIGVSKDAEGNEAYRMALQTREQHIKREKATSNICTAQVLLAVMSSMYAVYHGPEGLKKIAQRTAGLAHLAAQELQKAGVKVLSKHFFDTIAIAVDDADEALELGHHAGLNFRKINSQLIGISFDETHSIQDVQAILLVLTGGKQKLSDSIALTFPTTLTRQSDYLSHPVFNQFHSEHEMLRYMKRLENKDLSLVHSMISLGSCTMKLNATSEMLPVTWPEFNSIHPYAPANQWKGYKKLFNELDEWLKEITGFDGISFQPNSGAQGEYTGLMAIRGYHLDRGESQRNVALIPSSAHGTNPASAVMSGMKVVIVACDDQGNIDVEDLKAKATDHKDELAALMVTYPSTHGVFEESIVDICDIIHQYGGMVYMDGANMNAQVGLTSPAKIGADVCHLNLHKTFCIPHGGGGPGMGPIGVVSALVPFLPGDPLGVDEGKVNAVSAANFGSASILTISHAYIAMMGAKGLKKATELAILNANYIKANLSEAYPILYMGKNDSNAHELIIDCRSFKAVGIEVEDIAKRLMDYGYHAPTVSFPVAGTMMIEPTESESKSELDNFCNVMLSIREEIAEIEKGIADSIDNVLKNAPHTYRTVVAEEWNHTYSREKAAFPMESLRHNKFWPAASRVDSAYGDRNLICSCLPVEMYSEEKEEVPV